MINVSLAMMTVSRQIYASRFIQLTTMNMQLSYILNSCKFTYFFNPIISGSTNVKVNLDVFHTLFIKAPAISMKDTTDNCRNLDNQNKRLDETKVCINVKNSNFINCTTEDNGGAIDVFKSKTTFLNCLFQGCSALYGGTIFSSQSKLFQLNFSQILDSSAERFGAIYSDSQNKQINTTIVSSNITNSQSKLYIAAIRVEVTSPYFIHVQIANSFSTKFGAVWDWGTKPGFSTYSRCRFDNTTSDTEGGGITFFHWICWARVEDCFFTNGKGPSPRYIYVYSSESKIELSNNVFDQPYNVSVGQKFPGKSDFIFENKNKFVEEEFEPTPGTPIIQHS